MCAARCHAESGHAPLPRACSLDCKFSASFELADSQLRAAPAPCWPHPFAVKTSAQQRPEASLVESAQGESALMNQRHQRGEKRAGELRGAGGQCAQHKLFAPQARDLPMGRVRGCVPPAVFTVRGCVPGCGVLVPRHGSFKQSSP